jgi:DNA-binding XRE family transcriptional regulator
MKAKPSRGTRGKSAMDWARDRLADPAHREEVQAHMTEIDVRQDLITLRETRGWTQAQLAEQLGVHQPVISKLEGGGTKDVKLSTLVRVAAALGARVRIIFETGSAAAAKTKRQRKAAVA